MTHVTAEEQKLRAILVGAWTSRAITAAVELGVFDALADGPQDAASLAQTISPKRPADQAMLDRLLLFLVDADILAHDDDGYWLTDISALLVDGVERSLAPMARLVGAPWHAAAFSALPHAILTGTSGYEAAHGRPLFEALGDDEEAAHVFSRGVAPPESDNAALAAHLLLDDTSHIVDVGGGDGGFLASLLVEHPRRSGTVFDLPSAAAAARETLKEQGVDARARFVAGSFFDSIPDTADTYLLRWVLHNWSDDDATRILTRVASAMKTSARLHVTELVLPDEGKATTARLLDLDMMVLLHGRERTLEEFRALFEAAGLLLDTALPTDIGFTILTARKRISRHARGPRDA